MGVRALVIKDDKVLLVTHTYVKDWYAVGGGIDKGETPLEAIKRELMEEVGVELSNPPQMFGIYHNTISRPDDFVVLYIVKDFIQKDVISDEILEKKWFSLDNLPKDIAAGTKRRIEEYIGKREISEKW